VSETHSVAILKTGVANLASVVAAVARTGSTARIVEHPEDVEAATHLIFPGVGSFGAGMRGLESRDLAAPLKARIEAGRPTLAICLGLRAARTRLRLLCKLLPRRHHPGGLDRRLHSVRRPVRRRDRTRRRARLSVPPRALGTVGPGAARTLASELAISSQQSAVSSQQSAVSNGNGKGKGKGKGNAKEHS
jgi:hypothetical protein